MSAAASPKIRTNPIHLLLAVFILCRLVLLVFAPHCDPSESRYAEIARKMVETGNWVTPQFAYGVPFWAKPPLGMWMSALGIELFGANEFGSRIFIFVAAIGILALVARTAHREYNGAAGVAAAAILMGIPLFFYCSAAVMTDLALLLGTTLAMLGFRSAVTGGSRPAGYLFFIGLAIGLLAKGPLALVISVPPVVGWIVLTGGVRRSWEKLPWISGSLLMLGIAVPWYLLAEKSTPGFLDYFLVGEHWKRFTEKGWGGDLYGRAHAVPPGMIWFLALATSFPWCLGFLALPFRRWRNLKIWALEADGRGLYWLLWALWPLVFFTPARNVIATYPLPAMPAIALLLAEIFWRRSTAAVPSRFHPLHPALLASALFLVAWAMATSLVFPTTSPKHSERALALSFLKHCKPGDHLAYLHSRKYSAEFYTEGEVTTLKTPAEVESQLAGPGRLFLAAESKYFARLPDRIREKLVEIGRFPPSTKLFIERTDPPVIASIAAHKPTLIGTPPP